MNTDNAFEQGWGIIGNSSANYKIHYYKSTIGTSRIGRFYSMCGHATVLSMETITEYNYMSFFGEIKFCKICENIMNGYIPKKIEVVNFDFLEELDVL